jgi:hypothetical protein
MQMTTPSTAEGGARRRAVHALAGRDSGTDPRQLQFVHAAMRPGRCHRDITRRWAPGASMAFTPRTIQGGDPRSRGASLSVRCTAPARPDHFRLRLIEFTPMRLAFEIAGTDPKHAEVTFDGREAFGEGQRIVHIIFDAQAS